MRRSSKLSPLPGTAANGVPQPLYVQVKDHIRQMISSGQWPPHHRIPSENEIVADLGVSRMTVHRALREMTADGQLVRLQGVGTFVTPPRPLSALMEIRSIADEIADMGGLHCCEVLLLQSEAATSAVAKVLGIGEGGTVFHSRLLHRDRDQPIQLAERWVNPAAAPDYLNQDFTRETPSAYLCRVAPVTEAEHVIEASLPDVATARLLRMQKNEPCLVMRRTIWSGDMVASLSRFTYPGSRYRLAGRFQPQQASNRFLA